MGDHIDYSSSGQAQSMARDSSHYSNHSWSGRNQRTSSVPPPQPVKLPTPVQALRPLPNPHKAVASHALRVVNTPAPPTDQVNTFLRRNNAGSETGTNTTGSPDPGYQWSDSSHPRPQKKKSFVGGFVKGIRKFPRTMFGGSKKHQYDFPGGMSTPDGTSTGVFSDDNLGITPPVYRSNPSSPAIAVGPGRSGLRKQQFPNMVVTEPTIPESPPPDVVRLDSQRNSMNPSFRVSPPSGDYGGHADMYADEQMADYSQHNQQDHYENPADRTTVMVYDTASRHNSRPVNPPVLPIPRQRTPSPGLSYTSSEPVAPLRPSSYHSVHTIVRVPPPPVDTSVSDEMTPRPTYTSPAPRRIPSHSVLAGAPPISSSAPQPYVHTPPPDPTAPHPTAPHPEEVTSPMSIHPAPSKDYRKMSLLSSPSPTSNGTVTTATSHYDPSFTSLNAVERFFKTLYHMPWVSHNRVTVDYLPGEGASKRRRRQNKPMSSWYHSMFSNSRRSSATLDLLSNGTGSGTATSHNSSLHASLAQALDASLSRSHRRHASDKAKERRHRRHHSSRHHTGRHHDSHKRNRYTTSTDATADTHNGGRKASSPLIPAVYPFQYPPYPYPTFSSFPMPVPAPAPAPTPAHAPAPVPIPAPLIPPPQPSDRHARSPRGARHKADRRQPKQPLVYAPPAGYAPYQPVVGVPQVFLISPTSPGHSGPGGGVPTALVPGGVHDDHAHDAHTADQHEQHHPPAPGRGGSPNLPGAF